MLRTIREAADQLVVTPYTLAGWIRAGRIKAIRLGRSVRVAQAEIDRVAREGL